MIFIQFTKVILCVTLLILKLEWNIILYLNLESFYSTFTIRVYYQEKNSSWKSVQSKNSSHFVKFLISKGNSLFSRSYYAWKRKRTFFTLFSRRKTGYSLWSLQSSCHKSLASLLTSKYQSAVSVQISNEPCDFSCKESHFYIYKRRYQLAFNPPVTPRKRFNSAGNRGNWYNFNPPIILANFNTTAAYQQDSRVKNEPSRTQ